MNAHDMAQLIATAGGIAVALELCSVLWLARRVLRGFISPVRCLLVGLATTSLALMTGGAVAWAMIHRPEGPGASIVFGVAGAIFVFIILEAFAAKPDPLAGMGLWSSRIRDLGRTPDSAYEPAQPVTRRDGIGIKTDGLRRRNKTTGEEQRETGNGWQ